MWPSPKDQIARMEQALSMIDRLWKGETITEDGPYFRAKDHKLRTLPERRPPRAPIRCARSRSTASRCSPRCEAHASDG
jgi:alkanesulfonate monooxygenase SsuD/methylene tetrahydromethanopterin reductase-like flavin-dependent oxidoreductase (luciferase family)